MQNVITRTKSCQRIEQIHKYFLPICPFPCIHKLMISVVLQNDLSEICGLAAGCVVLAAFAPSA